jgi:hypothetical protein
MHIHSFIYIHNNTKTNDRYNYQVEDVIEFVKKNKSVVKKRREDLEK